MPLPEGPDVVGSSVPGRAVEVRAGRIGPV